MFTNKTILNLKKWCGTLDIICSTIIGMILNGYIIVTFLVPMELIRPGRANTPSSSGNGNLFCGCTTTTAPADSPINGI